VFQRTLLQKTVTRLPAPYGDCVNGYDEKKQSNANEYAEYYNVNYSSLVSDVKIHNQMRQLVVTLVNRWLDGA